MEGRYIRYDVPRVALTWMHLPPFARAIILSARLNATPVYAQVTSSLSSLMAACPLLSILRVRFMNCTLWICRRPPRDGIVNAPRGSLTKKCGGETRRIGGKDFFFSLRVECARSWNLMANLCSPRQGGVEIEAGNEFRLLLRLLIINFTILWFY